MQEQLYLLHVSTYYAQVYAAQPQWHTQVHWLLQAWNDALGYWLAQVMTAMFSSDLFRLPFSPARSSYGLASVVVLLAALLTSLGVAMRVAHLDLVRVLKGRD